MSIVVAIQTSVFRNENHNSFDVNYLADDFFFFGNSGAPKLKFQVSQHYVGIKDNIDNSPY